MALWARNNGSLFSNFKIRQADATFFFAAHYRQFVTMHSLDFGMIFELLNQIKKISAN